MFKGCTLFCIYEEFANIIGNFQKEWKLNVEQHNIYMINTVHKELKRFFFVVVKDDLKHEVLVLFIIYEWPYSLAT